VSGYALHPEAFADLDEIREYIAEDSPDAADRVIAEIFEAIRALVRFPDQGYRRTNLTSRPLRFKLVRECNRLRAGEKAPVGVGCVPRTAESPGNRGDSEGSGVENLAEVR
jgi:plasmid stabilization system protein ParE